MFAATGAFLELQAALNTIWRVKPNPNANLVSFVIDRIRSFGVVLAIGFLSLVSLAVSAALAALASWLYPPRARPAVALAVLNTVVSLGVITSLFALFYFSLPDVQFRARDVTMGAFVTALLFTIGKLVIGLYLGQSATASTYGAAGAVIVLLLWVYYSSQIVLLGAEFTRRYAERQSVRPEAEAFAEPDPDAPGDATTTHRRAMPDFKSGCGYSGIIIACCACEDQPMRCIQCPRCGDTNVALSVRSDKVNSYRCDKCGHGWSTPAAPVTKDDELPPLPAIDASGG